MRKSVFVTLSVFIFLLSSCTYSKEGNNSYNPPNIIIITADGLGFSDLGHFGSEINTPNLDMLAEEGLVISEFYNAGGTCQTYATLLTGLYPGQTGFSYSSSELRIKCNGSLNDQCATISEILKSAGYTTLMAGNWPFGSDPVNLPASLGFDRSFVNRLGDDNFYLNDNCTDSASAYIRSSSATENPFFLWLSLSTLQGHVAGFSGEIAKYKGKYDHGWESIRDQRFLKLINNGILSIDESISLQDMDAPQWDNMSETERSIWSGSMEIYAAIIDHLDSEVGKIIKTLDETGEAENTLIIFLSSSSGSDESLENLINIYTSDTIRALKTDSIYEVFHPWARVLNTPFHNGYTREGGISSPFIAYWPGGIDGMATSNFASHVIDIMPTLVEVSGASYPEVKNNLPVQEMEGISLLPLFSGDEPESHDFLIWEFMGSRALRMGDYKIVADDGDEEWHLYDIASDRCEQEELSEDAPQEVRGMQKIFRQESERLGLGN